jgi:hypothetical protein
MRLEARNSAGRFDPDRVFLALQSVDGEQDEGMLAGRESFSNLAHVAPDGSFQWTDVPAGSYYVQVMGDTTANEGWFVKSVAAAGRDVNESGITVDGGTVSLDLVISANGGLVEGVAVDRKGEPVANAVVVAVPEARMRMRTDHYRKTVADQTGRFSLRGLRPGDYTVYAWDNVDGEAYYNPDFLKTFEGRGASLHVSEGDRKSIQLEVIGDGAANEQSPVGRNSFFQWCVKACALRNESVIIEAALFLRRQPTADVPTLRSPQGLKAMPFRSS